MNITVIGAGNAGSTIAADLSRKGHCVSILRTSNKLHNEHFAYILREKKIFVEDSYCGDYEANVAVFDGAFERALENAQVIIVYVQTNYHEDIIKKMAPYLKDGQIVLFEPGYLSTCYLMRYCKASVVSIEAESSPIDCRIVAPGRCKVLFKNVLNPMGVYPSNKKAEAAACLDVLGFPYRFTQNVIEAALHNPNLIVHTIGALFSIPRIEYTKGDYWMYKEVFTPHVWNVCERLDNEKLEVLKAVGILKAQRYVEACQERNFTDDPRSPLESFFDYAMHSSPKGPSIPDSRYLTEDVSQGLVLLESLGLALDVATPVCTAIINMADAALGRDFREEGRTLEKLGSESIYKIKNDSSCVS